MLSQHVTQIRQRVRVILVDPTTRSIQGTLRDGAPIPITVWEVPATFVWPVVGEQWSVIRQSGMWILGQRIEAVDGSHSIEDLAAGESKIDSNTVLNRDGRTFVAADLTGIQHGDAIVWDVVRQMFVPTSRLSPSP